MLTKPLTDLRRAGSLLTLTFGLGLGVLPLGWGCGSTKSNSDGSNADSNATSTNSNSSNTGTSSGGASNGATSTDSGNTSTSNVSGFTTTSVGGSVSGTQGSVTTGVGNPGGSAGQAGASSMDGNAGSGGSAGQGAPCMVREDCLETERCDFPDDLCGDGEPGTCVPRSISATDGVSTCGCDGAIYQSVSYADWYGTDIDLLGRCTDGPAWCDTSDCHFSGWCGGTACAQYWGDAEPPETYCRVLESECATRYECAGWAALDCPERDCSCFDNALGCSEREDGYVDVVVNDAAIICE